MQERNQYAENRGCSVIDPENIDTYGNRNEIWCYGGRHARFRQFLSSESRSWGMEIGLKNSIRTFPNLTSDADFAVNEQCLGLKDATRPSHLRSKYSGFNIEYPSPSATQSWLAAIATAHCKTLKALNFLSLRQIWRITLQLIVVPLAVAAKVQSRWCCSKAVSPSILDM